MSELFDFTYRIINPSKKEGLAVQVKDCISQSISLNESLSNQEKIVRLNWFFGKTDESNCASIEEIISVEIESNYLRNVPYTIVAERPNTGNLVQLTLCTVKNIPAGMSGESKILGDSFYYKFKLKEQKWIFAGDNACYDNVLSVKASANASFSNIQRILEEEGLGYKNLIRQWNYIPGIVKTVVIDAGLRVQNYQEFNDVRAEWYNNEGLQKDFPAATGIGVSGGAVKIEVIAFSSSEDMLVLSLHNPEQADAHEYSADKLVGKDVTETPRFERGKLLFSNGKGHIWVSGTAAIRGEDSIPGDVSEQTRITCENIDTLISTENLIKSGLPSGDFQIKGVYIRAYVKDLIHGDLVQDILDKRYPGVPIHVLHANVCRDELLVEVEGEFSIRQLAH